MEWISVKDRLPKENGEYLVCQSAMFGDKEHILIARWTPKYNGFEERLNGRAIWYKYDSEYGDYEIRCITHWMTLPEPPKFTICS